MSTRSWTEGLVEHTFLNVLQAMYFKTSNFLETDQFNALEQVLGNVDLSGCASTIMAARIRDLLYIRSIANIFVQKNLSRTGFIVTIGKTRGKIVDRAVD